MGEPAGKGLSGLFQKFEQAEFFGDDHFGGGRWGGGADVGDPIGDGKIGFVADGGEDGDARFKDRLGDDLFVEGPKVFDAASASADDEDVGELVAVEVVDGLGNFLCRPFSLHFNGVEDDVRAGESSCQNVQDILDDGTCGAGDDTDAAGEAGQGLFFSRVEPAARVEGFFELVEFEEQFAHPDKLEFADDELVLAAGGVEADFPGGDDLVSLFGQAREVGGAAFEEDGGDLGGGVFQGKIEVAGSLKFEIADFSADGDASEGGFEDRLDFRGQFGDGNRLHGLYANRKFQTCQEPHLRGTIRASYEKKIGHWQLEDVQNGSRGC